MDLVIEKRIETPISPERMAETRAWHARALKEALAAGDVEEIERLVHNDIENFARSDN